MFLYCAAEFKLNVNLNMSSLRVKKLSFFFLRKIRVNESELCLFVHRVANSPSA